VISHELWQRRFGGDSKIIGRKIEVNNLTPMVVGVMPPGFRVHVGPGAGVPEHVELFFLGSLNDDGTNRQDHDIATIARLKPGVSFAQAQSELDALVAGFAQQSPQVYNNSNLKFHLRPLHQDLVKQVKPAILALLGAVGFVLLIACANVANLVLTRTDGRAKELAIRCALGAGRWRIIRQLLTENLLLALLGGIGGLLVAAWGVELLLYLRPANLPRQGSIGMDGTVLTVTLLAALLAGVVLGLIPAWQALKADVSTGLKESGRQSSGGRSRLRSGLVIAEVALSLVLLTGAGLMVRTFAKLSQLDWGFNPTNLLTMQISVQPRSFSEPEQRWQFYQQILEKVRSMPGVEAVSAGSPLPLTTDGTTTSYALDETAATPLSAALHTVLPGYLDTLGVQVLAGRDFTPFEIEQKLPLAIVDAKLARQAWPNENPIGKKLLWRPRTKRQQWIEVVAVVEHVKEAGFRDEGKPQLYVPYQNYALYDLALIVRGKTDLRAQGQTIKQEIERMGTLRPVHTIRAMDEYIAQHLAETRFALTLIGLLAALALSLCLVGLYSVIAYTVGQRTQEIGIRMALGAQGRDVLRLVLGQGITLIAAGVLGGLVGALMLTRALTSLLYGVSTTDPLTYVGAALLLTLVALIACYFPARRATKIDPLMALRYE
jgi:putative ABC transport system permease protein